MKEATGELNMTAITLGAIGVLIAFFYLVLWPNIKIGMALSSACSAGVSDQSYGDVQIKCTIVNGRATTCNYNDGDHDSSKDCTGTGNN